MMYQTFAGFVLNDLL